MTEVAIVPKEKRSAPGSSELGWYASGSSAKPSPETEAQVRRGGLKRGFTRLNKSMIATNEARAIAMILPRIPAWVLPLHLTIIGLAGAGLTATALVLCNYRREFVVLVPAGLFVHWFGDSLDGALARYRRIERPSLGFLIDHASDMVAISIILAGFALSPFMTPVSALLVLVMYLLYSGYTFIRVAVEGVHRMSYGGLGATEFRLLMAGWAIGAAVLEPECTAMSFHGLAEIDIVMFVILFGSFLVLGWIVRSDASRIGRLKVVRDNANSPP